jgi:predicted Zn finger-like uncharacterized protein
MFTVCPKCMLTLAVTAADLRMGQGYVRCGRCANVFNALLALSEEPVEGETTPPTPVDPASQSQITAALRGDNGGAARSSVQRPPETPPPPDLGGEPHAPLPIEQSSDGGIENASTFAEGTGTFETIVLEGEAITQTEEYVPEESVDNEIASLTRRLEANAQRMDAAAAEDGHGTDGTGQPADTQEAAEAQEAAPSEGAAAPAHEAQPRAESAEPLASESFAEPRPEASGPRWLWISGSAALGLLLALQLVNHWRDALALHEPLKGPLTRIYAALGMPLDPHWELAAYDVRQQGAAADPGNSEVVHVRLSLANHAARAQPLPLLRLTLLDRYGKRLASGELTPTQYWPPGTAPRALLAHDERVDCDVAVRDPGAVSASFELDVCLRDASGVLRCAGDVAPR